MADNQLPNGNIFKNVRTLEDIINVLSILYSNMNTLSRNYYDLFVNPIAMTVPMKLYDENGNLTEKDIPNVASYRTSVLKSTGDPNGKVQGRFGNFCIDTSSGTLYYYYEVNYPDQDNYWRRVDDETLPYLIKNGDGSELTNLSTDQLVRGILPVQRGGSGVNNIVGLIKGNGSDPFSQAVEGVDYMAPQNLTGMIYYFAGENLPSGWLVCDGSLVDKNTYQNLYNVIGDKYQEDGDTTGDSSNTFRLPKLTDKYIKGGAIAGTVGSGKVGAHTHTASGGETGPGTAHSHGPGTLNSTGEIRGGEKKHEGMCDGGSASGAFSVVKASRHYTSDSGDSANNCIGFNFNLVNGWDRNTRTASESSHTHSIESITIAEYNPGGKNEVDHITMIPIIKY